MDIFVDDDAVAQTHTIATPSDLPALLVELNANFTGVTFDTDANDYLTIQNLSLMHTRDSGSGVYINGSEYITVDSCTLSYNYWCGSNAAGNPHGYTTISNNTIEYNGAYGIRSARTNQSGHDLVTLNEISNNCFREDQVVLGIGGGFIDSTISYNTLYDNGPGGVGYATLNDAMSFDIADGSTIDIHHNTMYGNTGGAGIWLEGNGNIHHNLSYENEAGIRVGWVTTVKDVVVNIYYNICYGNNKGISQGGNTAGTFALNIYNNVLYDNTLSAPASSEEINLWNNVTTLVMKNNILSGTASNHNEFSAVTQTGATIDYNLYQYGTKYYNSVNRNWATWQGYGFDANGINTTDPLMTDPSNGDFTLQFGSRCINFGISVGLYLDYLGLPVPIGHRPDIGAYEHKNGSNAIW